MGCGKCTEACKESAIDVSYGRIQYIDRENCTGCGRCADVCWSGTLTRKGDLMSTEEVMDVIRRDEAIYRKSGGGVTLSGGEPLCQSLFSRELLKACRDNNISTAVETSGHIDTDTLLDISQFVNVFLYDIKHLNTESHKKYVGVSNDKILSNLETLSANGSHIIARVPLVPGFNMDLDFIKRLGTKITALSIKEVHLLPYHDLGMRKYRLLGMPYLMWKTDPPKIEKIKEIKKFLKQMGLDVVVHG
jgi:pyruvate formate lyase activating enzyme